MGTRSGIVAGVAWPVGTPKQLFIVDSTTVRVTASQEYGLADLFIGARNPVVFTMSKANLVRLGRLVNTALSDLDGSR